MRRPSIACYRAVPPPSNTALDHVWISDDLLSAAVSRFFRSTCPHQRRYGSHVPGPLEARRRAAKRRMTLQANVDFPGGMPPPLFSFGALFGSRQTGEPRWKYEPPSLKRDELVDFPFDSPPPVPLASPAPTAIEFASYPFGSTRHEPPSTVDPPLLSLGNSSIEKFKSDHLENSRNGNDLATETKNDQIFDFVPTHFAPTKDGSINPKNSHSMGQESGAQLGMEQGHRDQVDNSFERWARDSAGGHAQLVESLLSADAILETTESPPADIDACFQKFRDMVDGTAPGMYEMRPGTFLTSSYLTCCPSDAGAGRFCLLVLQHLLDSPWPENYIVGLLGQPSVRLPDVMNSEGLQFLHILEKRYLAPSMPRYAAVHLIYKRLAEQVQKASASSSSTPKASVGLLMGDTIDRDVNLRLLIRGLWDSAHWNIKRGRESPAWQTKRLLTANNQGLENPYSSGFLLRGASYGLSDRRLAHRLRNIWDVLSTDYLKAPQHFGNLVVACVKDHAKIPMALDLLEILPHSLLRNWIASMSVPRGEVQTVPQLGRRGPPYVQMWFKLLYRLDMRRNAGTDEQTSLCQFAFRSFVRAHFEHRYPPFTLVVALQYGLLGHDSLSGKSSLDLLGYIESNTLISSQQDRKRVSLNGMLAKLMSDLADKSLPNHGVLELLVPYISEHKSFHSVANLLERLAKRKTKLSSTAFLASYTDHVLEEVSKEFESTRLGYNIASFNRLLNAQLALGVAAVQPKAQLEALQSRRFFNHILARANSAHIVPLAYRNLTSDIPKEVQADLIHQFAYQYAMDRTRSCQQNWRSIRYLYLYLKIHNLPIQPLFTRTVVSVCIRRPLAENLFVAQKKAVWVCRLVAKVEGEAVARQVEQYFWAWRGDLILRAKRELVNLGVYDMAHVTTMERLKLLARNPRTRRESEEEADTQEHDTEEG